MEVMPHLKLRDDLGIQYAILPGDPARVERIAEQLEDVEELEFNREYKSIAGTYKESACLQFLRGSAVLRPELLWKSWRVSA